MTETVWLQRPSADVPWGFRLHGGRDYQTPLSVQKVTPGSIAATGLSQDDVILRIGDIDTSALTYTQAMDVIKNSGNLLQLSISKRGGQGAYRPQVEATPNMASGALHDLFEDMYRYSDVYAQEGALPQSQPAPPPSAYPTPPVYPASGDPGAGFEQRYGAPSGGSYRRPGPGTGPAPGQPGPPAPPSYADVQTHRDHVAYSYQPPSAGRAAAASYTPFQQPASSTPAPNPPYQYPQSLSSSTSELSDVSSGIGASDGKLTSPALGTAMTSPSAGGAPRPYASGSSVESSSGLGSYSCETPEHGESAYRPQPATAAAAVGRQDSFPPPPPPLGQETHPTRLEQQLSNMDLGPGYGRQDSEPSPVPPSPGRAPPGAPARPESRPQPVVPDAVLNMAARGEPDKKPWTYTPDMESIKEQRDKVRRSLKKDQGKDITQSPVYRMVHGLDDDKKSRQRRVVAGEGSPHKAPRTPADDDELSFSGVLDRSEIPSKSFHKLQNMTTGSEIDTTSIRQNISGEVPDEEIGAYDQASIRYTGKNIPSRSFKMLQSLTGDDTSGPDGSMPQPRRQRRHRPEPPPEEPEQNPDDIVDISYVGGNIPSRSFKVLQHAVGEPDTIQPATARHDDAGEDDGDGQAWDEMYYLGDNIPSRSFQLLQSVVGSDPHAVAQERRLRRRKRISSRQNSRTEEEMTSCKADEPFDEDAYLAGQIPLNVDPEEKPKPKRAVRTVSRDLAPYERQDPKADDGTSGAAEFDEDAYLAGRIPILGNEPKRPRQPLPSETSTSSTADAEECSEQQSFDEEAYLAGRISILGGEPKPRTEKESKDSQQEVPWKKLAEQEKTVDESEFDEDAYLSGKLPILGAEGRPKTGLPLDKKTTEEEPEWVRRQRAKLARKQRSRGDQFDEDRFLGVQNKESGKDPDEGEENTEERNFDEEAYLAGKIEIVGGNPSAPKREPKPTTDDRAPWQKAEETEGGASEGFDEEAYLQGKVPILRDSVPRELPPRDANKPKHCRQRAPWERDDDDDKPVDASREFDEDKYLAGKADVYVRRSVDRESTSPGHSEDQFSKIPSRTFHYLRRSMSREMSPPSSTSSDRPPSRRSSSYDSDDDDNKPYNEMVYVGKKIPSKAFLRLERSMARKASSGQQLDPIMHIKERMSDSVDVDSAMEKLKIDQHDPDKYLDQLKRTVEATSNIKIEAIANEVTDF